MRNATPFALTAVCGFSLLAVQAAVFGVPVPYTADSNTQLLYHLDETSGTTAVDSSGHGRNGTYGTGVTLGQAALPGFGTSIKTSVSNTARMVYTTTDWAHSFLNPANTSDFTLDAWIKLDNIPTSSYANIITVQPKLSASVDYHLFLYHSDTYGTTLSFGDGGTVNKVVKYIPWETDTWYHVSAVIHQDFATPANSSISLYRGKAGDPLGLVTSTTGASMILSTNSSTESERWFSVGNYYGANGTYLFPGLVDEVRFQGVPEPATGALILLGGGLLALRRRRRG